MLAALSVQENARIPRSSPADEFTFANIFPKPISCQFSSSSSPKSSRQLNSLNIPVKIQFLSHQFTKFSVRLDSLSPHQISISIKLFIFIAHKFVSILSHKVSHLIQFGSLLKLIVLVFCSGSGFGSPTLLRCLLAKPFEPSASSDGNAIYWKSTSTAIPQA